MDLFTFTLKRTLWYLDLSPLDTDAFKNEPEMN